MTEQTSPHTTAATETHAVEQADAVLNNSVKNQPTNNDSQQNNRQPSPRSGRVLSSIAIVLTLALGAGGYYVWQQQSSLQKLTTQALQAELDQLRPQLDQLTQLQQGQRQEKQRLDALNQQQEQRLAEAVQQQTLQAKQLTELQNKVNALAGSDTKLWLLAQADFMVKMAGRTLWNEHDVATTILLLKSADTTIAEMNDPSLLELRRAITADITALNAINPPDRDGITLRLTQLADQVDNLKLLDTDRNNTNMPMDQNSTELSGSLKEWRRNLAKSWNNFVADFITIRRRDSSAEPLLAPNQDIYLRENIRSRLLVAAQSVPRQQSALYQHSLEAVSTWVRAYFNPKDHVTETFLAELTALGQQSITLDLPQQLGSQPILDKLMQARVHTLSGATPAASITTPLVTPAPHQEG